MAFEANSMRCLIILYYAVVQGTETLLLRFFSVL